jgi:hypothetical protein
MASEIAGHEFSMVGKCFFELTSNSAVQDFHGLRDFYSFCKHLKSGMNLALAVQRNFGGIPTHLDGKPRFASSFSTFRLDASAEVLIPSIDLIEENIREHDSRHLMVISHNNFAANLLRARFSDFVIIQGNLFGPTTSEEKLYQLRQIRVAMERGIVVMLRNAPYLHESLYDVLNRRETVIGQKKYSIISDGYQSQSCIVSPGFKLILLVETREALEELPPPFLNRFEKHFLYWDDESRPELLKSARKWAETVSLAAGLTADDLIVGNHNDFFKCIVSSNLTPSEIQRAQK